MTIVNNQNTQRLTDVSKPIFSNKTVLSLFAAAALASTAMILLPGKAQAAVYGEPQVYGQQTVYGKASGTIVSSGGEELVALGG